MTAAEWEALRPGDILSGRGARLRVVLGVGGCERVPGHMRWTLSLLRIGYSWTDPCNRATYLSSDAITHELRPTGHRFSAARLAMFMRCPRHGNEHQERSSIRRKRAA